LKAFARQIKLDTAKFDECMDSERYKEIVQQQSSIARQVGVSSTPAFVINGYIVLGAQPFEVFQQVIDGELK
jgi:predicted DsbA family dithiol-disulfide isomerase